VSHVCYWKEKRFMVIPVVREAGFSLIDHSARTRNFEDTGDSAFFYYVTLKAEGCTVLPERSLIRQEVRIKVLQ
jgi:hypothetical protein